MERMDQALRALLQAALSELGSEAPALTDVTIEPAPGCFELRLWLVFSNGYGHLPTCAGACHAFCERHAAWDVETFRQTLLREARRMYARMLQEKEQRTWIRRLMQRLPNGIERAMRSRRATWALYERDARHFDGGTPEAQGRSLQLLTANLTAAQREQYRIGQYFDVTGGTSGKRYRVRHGRSMNIEQLDESGQRVCGWCFLPKGRLVAGDIMLSQKVALELYELEGIQVAHKIAATHH